jgi:transcriptional regulator with XRE-family HTH domain
MRIGFNIRRYREKRGWSQEALGSMVGKSQSTISSIESNEQDVPWELLESFAQAFHVTTDELAHPDTPVFNSHHQQGGHANNYIIQNGADAALAAKDEVIAAKNETIETLKKRIQELESALRRT